MEPIFWKKLPCLKEQKSGKRLEKPFLSVKSWPAHLALSADLILCERHHCPSCVASWEPGSLPAPLHLLQCPVTHIIFHLEHCRASHKSPQPLRAPFPPLSSPSRMVLPKDKSVVLLSPGPLLPLKMQLAPTLDDSTPGEASGLIWHHARLCSLGSSPTGGFERVVLPLCLLSFHHPKISGHFNSSWSLSQLPAQILVYALSAHTLPCSGWQHCNFALIYVTDVWFYHEAAGSFWAMTTSAFAQHSPWHNVPQMEDAQQTGTDGINCVSCPKSTQLGYQDTLSDIPFSWPGLLNNFTSLC